MDVLDTTTIMVTLDHLARHVNRVRFLKTTLYLDSDRGEISVDVTRDGTFYIEGPLGRVKTDRVRRSRESASHFFTNQGSNVAGPHPPMRQADHGDEAVPSLH